MKKRRKIKEITNTGDVAGYQTPKFLGKGTRAKKSTLKNQWVSVKRTYKHTKKR